MSELYDIEELLSSEDLDKYNTWENIHTIKYGILNHNNIDSYIQRNDIKLRLHDKNIEPYKSLNDIFDINLPLRVVESDNFYNNNILYKVYTPKLTEYYIFNKSEIQCFDVDIMVDYKVIFFLLFNDVKIKHFKKIYVDLENSSLIYILKMLALIDPNKHHNSSIKIESLESSYGLLVIDLNKNYGCPVHIATREEIRNYIKDDYIIYHSWGKLELVYQDERLVKSKEFLLSYLHVNKYTRNSEGVYIHPKMHHIKITDEHFNMCDKTVRVRSYDESNKSCTIYIDESDRLWDGDLLIKKDRV